ncbi:MAG: DUF1572 family protein [Bacteroidia bacterium]|nr:DUF1572 family protein [Bacteroidia bacterium]
MKEELIKEFLDQSVDRIDYNTPRIIKCMNELEEEDIWKRPNNSSNSVGNLILHLCGNITQYIISSLGESPDIRERENEFSATGGYSKSELIDKLKLVVQKATDIIQNMSTENLLRKRAVQGFQYSGISIIIHVTEHYSYHTGQITFWTKLLKNKDLGFYADFDLNKKNAD